MSPFLHRCQCTRGFFVLRPCDAPASYVCARCTRHVCNEHWSAQATPPACVECAARLDEARAVDDDFDGAWFHRYRHRYYTTYHYRPFYHGAVIGLYYDDYDLRAFDATAAAGAGVLGQDDDGPGGLGDS
jgi:DNA-directed RNA polymerase subunit RPC12/RpoP